MLIEIARETGTDLPPARKVAAGDRRALRGIPVTGVPGGMGGTMAETNPLAEVLRREARREAQQERVGDR